MNRKKELLEHYAEGDVHRFLQLDGWTNVGHGDDVMRPDEDSDVIMFGQTDELRRSDEDLAVRVFIHEGTDHEVAVRLLKRLLVTLEDIDIPFFWSIDDLRSRAMAKLGIKEELEI